MSIVRASNSADADPLINVEAEAAILGALLIDNSVAARIDLSGEDFAEPVHARIFEQIRTALNRGAAVTPLTIRPHLEADEGLSALGGSKYLARLTADGQGLLAPREIAQQLRDLAIRRQRRAWLAKVAADCLDVGRPLADLKPPEALQTCSDRLEGLDLIALAQREPVAKAFVLPRFAPAGEVTLFTGAGGVGKSLLAQQLCTAVAAGCTTLGMELRRWPALYVTAEDDAEQLHFRQVAICRALGVNMTSLAGGLHLKSLRGEDNALAAVDPTGRFTVTPAYNRLAEWIRRTGAKLVGLDNVAHLFPENENDRREVTRFVNLLNGLAGETGAAILLLAHPNKIGSTFSGSTAWVNSVRSQVSLSKPDDDAADPDTRTLQIEKANYAAPGYSIAFRWSEWSFVREEDLPDDRDLATDHLIRANAENATFMACLAAATANRRAVSHTPGVNYFGAVFPRMPESKRMKRASFEAAFERLLSIGRIELDAELWRSENRHWKRGIKAVPGFFD